MSQILNYPAPMILEQDEEGAQSDNEGEGASKGFAKLYKLARVSSKCFDDSLIVDCKSPSKLKRESLRDRLCSDSFESPQQDIELQIKIQDCDRSNSTEEHTDGGSQIESRINDSQSMFSLSNMTANQLESDSQTLNDSASDVELTQTIEESEELLVSKAEIAEFMKPRPALPQLQVTSTVFQPSSGMAFAPSSQMLDMVSLQAIMANVNQDQMAAEQPSYKVKEKTEICKYWLNGQDCKFGSTCAFAHGDHELVKKVHVASKYRMTLCKSFMDGSCVYGRRCQFFHPSRDFSDFDQQSMRYQNLLAENATIMKSRIDQVADPDVTSAFNISMPGKPRLAAFESIISTERAEAPRTRGKKSAKQVQSAAYKPKAKTA